MWIDNARMRYHLMLLNVVSHNAQTETPWWTPEAIQPATPLASKNASPSISARHDVVTCNSYLNIRHAIYLIITLFCCISPSWRLQHSPAYRIIMLLLLAYKLGYYISMLYNIAYDWRLVVSTRQRMRAIPGQCSYRVSSFLALRAIVLN